MAKVSAGRQDRRRTSLGDCETVHQGEVSQAGKCIFSVWCIALTVLFRGLVVFAKTSKALSRLNNMFRDGEVHKTYWAIVKNMPKEPEATLTHWIVRNEKQNKSYAYDHEVKNSKKAILKYKVIGHTDHYTLLEVNLMTGRHHQIRCQLAKMGCPIKGDLKYGSPRSNADGSISSPFTQSRICSSCV